MASSATYRAASVLSSGVYYGGSAIVSTVNSITPHLAGAVDILVVEQPDGSRRSTPFYVRFGKYAAIRSREREVKIYVNGQEAPFSMVLGSFGQAYFASETVQLGSDSEHHDSIAEAMSPVSGYSSGDEPVNALGVPEQLAEGVDGGNNTVVDLGTIQSEHATTHVQLQHPDNNAATISEVTVYRDSEGAAKAPKDDRYRRQVSWPALGNENIASPTTPPRSNSTLVCEQPPADGDGEWMSSSEAAARAVAAVDAQLAAVMREQAEVTSRSKPAETLDADPDMEPSSSFAGVVPDFIQGKNEACNGTSSQGEDGLGSGSPEEVSSLRRLETRYLSISSLPSFKSIPASGEESLTSIEESVTETTQAVSAAPLNDSTTSHAWPTLTPHTPQEPEVSSITTSSSAAPALTMPAETTADDNIISATSSSAGVTASAAESAQGDHTSKVLSAGSTGQQVSVSTVDKWTSSHIHTRVEDHVPSTSATTAAGAPPSSASTSTSSETNLTGLSHALAQVRVGTPGSSRPPTSTIPTQQRKATVQLPAADNPTTSTYVAQNGTSDVPGPSTRGGAGTSFADVSAQSDVSHVTPESSSWPAKPPSTPLRDQEPASQGIWPQPSALSPNINIPTPSKHSSAFVPHEREQDAESHGHAHGEHHASRGYHPEVPDVPLSPPHGGSFDSGMSPYSSFEAGYMGDVERRVKEGGAAARQGLPTAPGAMALGIQGFELSLCGHLLSKDMGAGEAQQVFEAHKVTAAQFTKMAMQLTQSQDLVVRMGTTLYPWSAAAPIVLGMLAFGGRWDHLTKEGCWKLQDGELHAGTKLTPPRKQQAGWRLWPFGSWGSSSSRAAANTNTANTHNNRSYSAPAGATRDLHLDSLPSEDPTGGSSDEGGLVSPPGAAPHHRIPGKQHVVVKKKTVGPTSEQLASLPLQEGQNHITYRIGKSTELHAYVYLMKWTARLVISDIDGTITKSDILGHVLPAIGYDWSHPGITQLFTNVTQNGYKMMYLSSRSIAQASITRDYLHSLDQEGNKMPQGPVIISPQGILPSLYREMILRRPHEFKIACLRDIRSLFPEECNPFYAGFGNRDTDLLSYKEVGVPTARIFIINPKGELRKASSAVQSSTWSSLKAINALVHEVFPPNEVITSRSQSVDESFSDLNYWRSPMWIPDVDAEEEELLKPKLDKSSSSRFKRSPSEISSDFISSINPL